MPSSVVHLYVADMLADSFDVKDRSQFFLGAISPDTVNLGGFADERTRYAAHIRSKNVSRWLADIKKFIFEKSDEYKKEADFFKGFVVHLLTDIAWDLCVQPELFEALEESGVSSDGLRKEKWNELYRFNGQLFKLERWKNIKAEISRSVAVSITTVSAELLSDFKAELLGENYSKVINEPPRFLDFSHIAKTAEKVTSLYEKYLK